VKNTVKDAVSILKDMKSMKIPLTQGKFALVDAEDYEYLNKYKWCAVTRKRKDGKRQCFYAVTHPGIRMHRLIMKTPRELEVDHKDGDGLNNQKHNLRNCTRLQNVLNQMTQQTNKTSKYRGVLWNAERRWRVQIQYKSKVYYLGYFDCEEEAARCWDKKAKELFGEFARLNFPE
jgi:hypothetical protein